MCRGGEGGDTTDRFIFIKTYFVVNKKNPLMDKENITKLNILAYQDLYCHDMVDIDTNVGSCVGKQFSSCHFLYW